ncbi:MAG: FxLYD domain-containing protein [Actinobacteria bacterium]|nr:FxLYD domain-containing protein [Actinomycetota bacterium]
MTSDEPSDTAEADQRRDWDPVTFDSATPPAEWALAAIGAVFACVIIALLVVQALARPDTLPQLSTQTTRVTERGDQYVVVGEVTNTGGTAASNVQVEGRVIVDGSQVDQAGVQVDYVPAGASESFILVFSRDPTDGRLVVAPTGFIED